MKKSTLIFAFLVISLSISHGQKRMALFLHGFSSNRDVGWLNSGTPQGLKNEGIITDWRVPSLPVFTNISAMQCTLSQEFAGSLPQDKWMIVGHSLGGLIARSMESPQWVSLLQASNVNWKGTVTLGTPHQGAPAALNYLNALPIIEEFESDVLAGPQADVTYGWATDPALLILLMFNGQPMHYYEALAYSLRSTKDAVRGLIEEASGLGADELAPGSNFINSLQSIPANVKHLSIGGVESSPSLIRWAPTIDIIAPEGGVDEDGVVEQFNEAKDYYDAAYSYHLFWEDLYDTWSYADPSCYWSYCDLEQMRDIQAALKSAYGAGWWQLNGIDDRWFELHNEMLSTTVTTNIWIACGREEGGLRTVADALIKFQEYDPCAFGAEGYWTSYTVTYYFAEKSDGYVPLNRTKWKSWEGFANTSLAPAALPQANVYFDGAGEIDGYNHSELRNLLRTHGPEIPSQPMTKAKDWMNYWFDN